MDREQSIKHLLAVPGITPAEVNRLKLTANAYTEAARECNASKTVGSLKAMQAAEKALDDCVAELWAKYHPEPAEESDPTEPFRSREEVAAFVQSMGFKCSARTVSNHTRSRKLVRRQDGFWHREDVIAWIKKTSSLHRLDGGSDDLKGNDLQHRKLDAETRRAEADARLKKLKADVLEGKLIPLERFEREVAGRASIFKRGLQSTCHSLPESIIEMVGGDPNRAPHLLDLLLREFGAHLNHYDTDQPFHVPLERDELAAALSVLDEK